MEKPLLIIFLVTPSLPPPSPYTQTENDILFNGQTKSLEISLPNEDNYWNEAGYIWSYRNIGLRFYLHNISQDYYYYRRSLELYNQSSDNPFAQPVQVYSNIENGFGIFAGAQVNYFDIEL